MAHEHRADAIRAHGDKMGSITGERGEHPLDRAERIAGVKVSGSVQGDSAQPPEECFTAAPARQISNLGNVRK